MINNLQYHTKEFTSNLNIEWTIAKTPIGYMLIACINDYLCYIDFINPCSITNSLFRLKKYWPKAKLSLNHKALCPFILIIKKYFLGIKNNSINIIMNGTNFQLAVWKILLTIPEGTTITYQDISLLINQHNTERAIGTAVGQNPIGCIIPCHRVIGKNKLIGHYRWGVERKYHLLTLENERR